MESIDRNKQFEGVSGWWNSKTPERYDNQHNDDCDVHAKRVFSSREKKVLQFVDDLHLPKGAKVLELGYGPGFTALQLGKRGLEIHGVDISATFCEIATRRCTEGCPEGEFFFRVGNIENNLGYEDNSFDLVLLVGVFHYLYSDDSCLQEVYRVLKPGGHLIVCQRKTYGLAHLTSFRVFMRSCIYFLFSEKYEVFPSFKAMLCDTKLGLIFGRYQESKWMNTKMMLKNHDVWKFKLKKKLYTGRRLCKSFERNGLSPIRVGGAYFCFSIKPKYYDFNIKLDDFLVKIFEKKYLGFLSWFTWMAVVVSQKDANRK